MYLEKASEKLDRVYINNNEYKAPPITSNFSDS
jgi:hypothetical protein